MEHIFDGITPTDITTQTTNFMGAIAPIATLLIGILLAFLVIKSIIGLLTGNKKSYVIDDDDDDDDDEQEDW